MGGIVASFVVLALIFGTTQERTYSAESVVSVVPVEQGLGQFEREVFLESVTGISASDTLLEEAISASGWRGTTEDFSNRLEPEYFVRENGESGMIVRFSGRSPEESARVANTYAVLFVERIRNLNEQRITEGESAAEANIRTEAVADEVNASFGPIFYSVVALVAGLVLGGGIALLLEGRARNWRDARDAEVTLRSPVLGVIPDYALLVDSAEKPNREETGAT